MKVGTLSRYLYNHVHKSIIQHSQKMEATYASIGKCMEKQNVIYVHSDGQKVCLGFAINWLSSNAYLSLTSFEKMFI